MTSQSHLTHIKYRPDIDGLRAIAVLAVVIYHAFPSVMKGGFIGVDIFFVISGYLISRIIFESLDKGTFSFSEFYSRRIKRIFPALILILIACIAFGWFTLFADEYKQLGGHVVGGAGFFSNLLLWNEAGYFDNSSDTKPLLHLWSLGIEEQFYIVWPLLLYFAWKRKFNFLTIITLIAIASFIINIKGVKQDAVATFYSPQTRFWELLSGSLLAWFTLYSHSSFASFKNKVNTLLVSIVFREPKENDGQTLSDMLSLIGLLILSYGFFTINKELSFPGRWALLPVLGTVLIITAGSRAWVNRNILSNKTFVWFGLISFPLYLWHWPLLSYARIVVSEVPSNKIRFFAVVLSIILAWLTYKIIESPIRSNKNNKTKVTVLIMLMVFVGSVGYCTFSQDGLKFREVLTINTSLSSGVDGGDLGNMVGDCGVKEEVVRGLFRMCAKDKRGNVRFALMGDSKADALYTGLVRTSNEEGRWLFIGGNGVNGAPTPLLAKDPDPSRPLTNYAIDAILSNKEIETVVLVTAIRAIFSISDGVKGGNLNTYDYTYLKNLSSTNRSDLAYQELNRVVDKFVNNGKKVVIVVDNPALPNPQDCIGRRTSSEFINKILVNHNQDCAVPIEVFNSQIKIYRQLLLKIKSSHSNTVRIFDPTDIYCGGEAHVCTTTKNGRLMYSYTDHISDYASGLVGRKLNEFLVNDKQ